MLSDLRGKRAAKAKKTPSALVIRKLGTRPIYALITTVCATRSPSRCFSSEDQMRIAPSR
jgi:hypothetical protein